MGAVGACGALFDVSGVALPATLLASIQPLGPYSLAEMGRELSGADHEATRTFDLPAGRTVRIERLVEPSATGEGRRPVSFTVSYLTEVPGRDQAVVLTFGTPAIALVDPLRVVFHQIACSLLINPAGQVQPPVGCRPAGARRGALMRPGSPGLVPIAPPGSLALLVASGPAAGASAPLPSGQTVVGREAPFPLDDEEISRHHITVTVDRGGTVTVADPGSRNGTVVSGLRLGGERPLPLGELIWAGSTALTIARAPAADAALVPADDGSFRYSRSPRLAESPRHARRAMPDPPPEPERPSFPMVAVITPVFAGVLMAFLFKQLQYLAFIALSPMMVIGNAVLRPAAQQARLPAARD